MRDDREGLPADGDGGGDLLKVHRALQMKDLEKENIRLRRAVSDLRLEKRTLQETGTPGRWQSVLLRTRTRPVRALTDAIVLLTLAK